MRAFVIACLALLLTMPAAGQDQQLVDRSALVKVVRTVIAGIPGNAAVTAINNNGAIVGSVASISGAGANDPFVWTAEQGLQRFLGGITGGATDINDHNVIVGVLAGDDERNVTGFRWSAAEGLLNLGKLLPTAINNAGQIVGGCFENLFGPRRPCMWENGGITEISGGAEGLAYDINDDGAVVGQIHLSAFLWSAAEGVRFLPTRNPEQDVATAVAINDTGQIAGNELGADVVNHAVRWSARHVLRTLALRESVAVGIDRARWIVGRYLVEAEPDHFLWHGFVWGPEGELIKFGLALPVAMSGDGAILGTAVIRGQDRVVVWRITRETPPLSIETPNSTARWGLNTHQRLAWSYAGEAPQFLIEISRNSGRTWDDLAIVPNRAGDSQNFDWQVTGPLTSAAKFRVSAIGDAAAVDVNDADIRIVRATIEMLSPTATTTVAVGAPLTIFYKHSLGAGTPVAIDISANNGTTWRTVANARTTGSVTASFRWLVDLLPTARARVRIRALDGSGAIDVSRAFTVTAPAS